MAKIKTLIINDEVTYPRTVVEAVEGAISKSVNNLVNYYLKSDTYTQAEVQALIGAIQQFHYEVYASTSEVTDPASNVLYLIGPTGSGADKYEEYVWPNSTLGFVKIGDTSIDLSGYVTVADLNAALHPDEVTIIPVGGLQPNVVYNLGELTGSVDFSLAAGTAGKINVYYWTFTTGSTPPTITTWPTGVSWVGGVAHPDIIANKHYEMSVYNGVGVWMEA